MATVIVSSQSSLFIGPHATEVAHDSLSNVALHSLRMFQKRTELAQSTDMIKQLPDENVTSLLWPCKSFLFESAMRSQRRNMASQDNVMKWDASLECETPDTKWLWPARRANCGGNESCVWLSFQTSVVLSLDAGL